MDLQQDLQFFHKLSKRYHSDLSFLNDELTFLKYFLKTNFPTLFSDKEVTRVQLLHSRLVQLKLVHENVVKDVLVHEGNLQSVINSVLIKSVDFLKIESERLEDEVRDLNNNFKRIKREIFAFYKDSTQQSLNPISKELQLD